MLKPRPLNHYAPSTLPQAFGHHKSMATSYQILGSGRGTRLPGWPRGTCCLTSGFDSRPPGGAGWDAQDEGHSSSTLGRILLNNATVLLEYSLCPRRLQAVPGECWLRLSCRCLRTPLYLSCKSPSRCFPSPPPPLSPSPPPALQELVLGGQLVWQLILSSFTSMH